MAEMSFGQTLVSGLINNLVSQGMSYLTNKAVEKKENEQIEKKQEGEMELRTLMEEAAMERLRLQLAQEQEAAILAAKAGIAREALSGVPQAYSTAIQGILGARAQQQGALQSIINAGQKAAMGNRTGV